MMIEPHTDTDQQTLPDRLEVDMTQLGADQREHFQHVMQALFECYRTEKKRALILIQEAVEEPQHLDIMVINSSAEKTDGMIETLCRFKGLATAQAGMGAH